MTGRPGVRIDPHVKILNDSVVERAKARGLDAVVYAPHFTPLPDIQASARKYSDDEFLVLPAREIFTGSWKNRKHILALNLTDPIPDFIHLDTAFSELSRQQAIILVPHPLFATISLTRSDIEEYQESIHGIEVYNLKHLRYHNTRADAVSGSIDLPRFGSSYAHLGGSIGEVTTVFPNCELGRTEILSAIRDGAPRTIQARSGLLHQLRRGAEISHLLYENSIQKILYTVQDSRRTTPSNPIYEGKFDDRSVYPD